MDRLFFFLGDIQHTKLGGADSFSDQLNCKYTVYVLSLFAILATTKVYVGDPISCFCPANFPGSQVDYTDKFCWATNTHYQPFEHDLPKEFERKNYISYYQWVPLFLACQAMLFYLPRPIWRALSRKSGVVVYNITDSAIECQRQSNQDGAEKTMQYIANYTIRYLRDVRTRRDAPGFLRPFRDVYYAYYLTIVYLFIKLLYAVNVVGQLFFLNVFLGTDFHLYGVDVLRRMASGEDWTTSHRFPRVTICDFKIRVLGNIHRHTVQCALPMNLYNEMMYIFIWFWFVFVAAVSVASLLYWSAIVIGTRQQINYVWPRLAATGRIGGAESRSAPLGNRQRSFVADGGVDTTSSKYLMSLPANIQAAESGYQPADKRYNIADMRRFVDWYLTRDGCLVVRLVAENTSDLIAADLLGRLYDNYVRGSADSRPPPSNRSWGQLQSPHVANGPGDASTLDKNDNDMSRVSPASSLNPSGRPTGPRRRQSTSKPEIELTDFDATALPSAPSAGETKK